MSSDPICVFKNVPIWVNRFYNVNEDGEEQDSVLVYLDPEKEADCIEAGFNVHYGDDKCPGPYLIIETCTEKMADRIFPTMPIIAHELSREIPRDRIMVGTVKFTYKKFKYKDHPIIGLYVIDLTV